MGQQETFSLRVAGSVHRLRLREFPCAVQDFGARPIEPHHVVPALHDRQAIWNFAVAAAELDGDRAVVAFLRRDVVERIGVEIVWLEIALGVVEADRPEAIDGHILDVELVDRRAVVLAWRDVEINGVLIGIEAPARRGDDQVPDRIDLIPAAGCVAPVREGRAEHHQRIAHLLLAGRSQFGTSNLPGPPGCSTLIASCKALTCATSFGSFGSTRMRIAAKA